MGPWDREQGSPECGQMEVQAGLSTPASACDWVCTHIRVPTVVCGQRQHPDTQLGATWTHRSESSRQGSDCLGQGDSCPGCRSLCWALRSLSPCLNVQGAVAPSLPQSLLPGAVPWHPGPCRFTGPFCALPEEAPGTILLTEVTL